MRRTKIVLEMSVYSQFNQLKRLLLRECLLNSVAVIALDYILLSCLHKTPFNLNFDPANLSTSQFGAVKFV